MTKVEDEEVRIMKDKTQMEEQLKKRKDIFVKEIDEFIV